MNGEPQGKIFLSRGDSDFSTEVERLERRLIGRALQLSGGNKTRAAAMLGIKEISLQTVMTKRGIEFARDIAEMIDPLSEQRSKETSESLNIQRPPFNAEYLLYLFLPASEKEIVVGDLIESYEKIFERFNKRRADLWFCKQVAGSLLPLFRRSLWRIGALVWLGRILRRLIS